MTTFPLPLADLPDRVRELDARYPYGWRVGVDEKDRLVIWYVAPEEPRKAARKE